MERLDRLRSRPERIVAGLMSGTSLDGIDVAVARLRGSGRGLVLEQLAFTHTAYDPALREVLGRNVEAETSSVKQLSQLHALLGRLYAEAIAAAVEEAGLRLGDLDLVGSHGQTVHHVPDPEPLAGYGGVTSTLQLGDTAAMAARLGCPVVGDFRAADMALGGQGAPLVPYFDYVCFCDPEEQRALLNLGGIGNVTVLPPAAEPEAIYAFDTGPANMVLDALAQRLFGVPYDADGRRAATGMPDEALVARLLTDEYYHRPPPKSTGREKFGAAFVDALVADGPARPEDLLATATALTARSVALALERFVTPHHPLDVLVVSGGGTHNSELMRQLRALLAPVPVRTSADYGIDPDAKEALCFAVLAHEFINGVPTNLPSVTGAARPALLGKLALPG